MDPSLAETLRRVQAIIDQDQLGGGPSAGLADAFSTQDLERTAIDPSEDATIRCQALRTIADRVSEEATLARVIATLLDDPCPQIVVETIRCAPAYDAKILETLRRFLHDPREEVWQAAATSLARKKDHALLPLMKAWSLGRDPARRRQGLSSIAFLLLPEDHLAFVEEVCEQGPIDDEDEQVLIESLRVAEHRVAFWRKAAHIEPS